MTPPTQGEHAQPEALRLAEILEGDYCPDWFYEQGVDEVAAELRRMHAENERLAAQVAAHPAAPQGGAYAELPEHLTLAVDRWFAENTGLGGCSDKDVRELAALFYGVHHAGGRESVDDALAIVESFGPGIGGLNDTYARQILLAEEVKRLRASHGQAPAGAASEVDLPDAEDMAHSALQEALSFGLSHDVVYRWMRAIQDQTVKAMAAAPTAQPALAATPQADSQPAPVNAWQQAIDHELVMAHLGVAGAATFEEARKALHELICWHIDVATDPATNGGKVLVDASRTPADSVTAPAAGAVAGPSLRDEIQRLAQFADQATRMGLRDMHNNLETLAEELTKLLAAAPTPAAQGDA